jgi:hypothetical protein
MIQRGGGEEDLHKNVYSRAIQKVRNDQKLGIDPVVQQLNNPNKLCDINKDSWQVCRLLST